jgi:hypothetical protein
LPIRAISENKQDRWTRSAPAEVGLPVLLKSPECRQSPRNIWPPRGTRAPGYLPTAKGVSAGAKIPIVPIENSPTPDKT